jgi:hypothetical protein
LVDSALESVDEALESATKVEAKTSKVVDERFEKAINALIDYETDCHCNSAPSDGGRRANSVRERMDAARAKDKSSSTTLNTLKEKSRMKVMVSPAHVTSVFCSLSVLSRYRMNGRNQRK